MWRIFGRLLWNLKTKFQTPPYTLSESIVKSLVTSNIRTFRRTIDNDLLAAFSCEALLKDLHMTEVSITASNSWDLPQNTLNWRYGPYGIPLRRTIPSPTPEQSQLAHQCFCRLRNHSIMPGVVISYGLPCYAT